MSYQKYSISKRVEDVLYLTEFYPKTRVCIVESRTSRSIQGKYGRDPIGGGEKSRESMRMDDARDLWAKLVKDGYEKAFFNEEAGPF